ncbi:MAG: hypothetical protein K2Q06_07395 [Parvularculaceae bacterium]|nr:hypothetical protein [Parvularculaceae bacterium]
MTAALKIDGFAARADGGLSAEEMYRRGLAASTGVDDGPADLVLAHKWFNLAAMHGNIEARAYRAELAREMTPDEVAEAQRLAREYLAATRARP